MVRLLKREVAEGLGSESVHVRHKPRVGVVLDVAAINEMLHPIEGTPLATFELYDVSLAKVDLSWRKKSNLLLILSRIQYRPYKSKSGKIGHVLSWVCRACCIPPPTAWNPFEVSRHRSTFPAPPPSCSAWQRSLTRFSSWDSGRIWTASSCIRKQKIVPHQLKLLRFRRLDRG